MIVVTKVDLHSLKLDRLNEMISAGYKPIAWVPYSNRMVVFLEGENEYKTKFVETVDEIPVAVVDEDKFLPVVEIGDEAKDIICKGITVAGNPCKASKFEGTEYCVAHQDQG